MTLTEIAQQKSLFATRKVGNEMVLVPLKNNIATMNEMFTLNVVGRFIWEQIDGNTTETQIIQAITDSFDIDEHIAKNDFDTFIKSLTKIMGNN